MNMQNLEQVYYPTNELSPTASVCDSPLEASPQYNDNQMAEFGEPMVPNYDMHYATNGLL